MIEMAVGMLVFALILSGLLMFGEIIPESMRLQSMVRCQAGYEAQAMTSGTVEGVPLPHLDEVIAEPEVVPVVPNSSFSESSTRPFEFRVKAQTFSIDLDPVASEWYWDGKSSFRGMEECYMPLMTIPEFSATEALP